MSTARNKQYTLTKVQCTARTSAVSCCLSDSRARETHICHLDTFVPRTSTTFDGFSAPSLEFLLTALEYIYHLRSKYPGQGLALRGAHGSLISISRIGDVVSDLASWRTGVDTIGILSPVGTDRAKVGGASVGSVPVGNVIYSPSLHGVMEVTILWWRGTRNRV